MYRSSTTFCEQYLNSLNKSTILHQPYPSIFKLIRDSIFQRQESYALGDLPFDTRNLFDIDLDSFYVLQTNALSVLESDIYNVTNHPGINAGIFPSDNFYTSLLDSLKNDRQEISCKKLIQTVQASISEMNKSSSLIGFKEIFATEYAPALLNSNCFDNIVICVRDPREIYFSRNYVKNKSLFGTTLRHPVIMIAQIWKRQFQIIQTLREKHPDRTYVVDYRVLKDSEDTIKNMLANLHESSATQSKLDWTVNTSSDSGMPGYGANWEEKMSTKHVAVIEHICRDELELGNYNLTLSYSEASKIASSFEEDFRTVKGWCQFERYRKTS